MIPKIKKILYTTDLSKNARFAFSYAASVANSYNAKITILHVLETLSNDANVRIASILGEDRWKELRKRNENEVVEKIRGRLTQFCEEMSAELHDCPFIVENVLIKSGEPVEEILRQARSKKYDLVLMGTHGQGRLADVMLGSTARRVVRRCETPVMVVRLPEDDD